MNKTALALVFAFTLGLVSCKTSTQKEEMGDTTNLEQMTEEAMGTVDSLIHEAEAMVDTIQGASSAK